MPVTRDEGSTLTLADLIVLEEHPGIARRPARPVTTGLYHVALLVPNRRELGRSLLGLHQAGYPLRGMSDHAVSESCISTTPMAMASRSMPIVPGRCGRFAMAWCR